jgi:phage terminase small subunit
MADNGTHANLTPRQRRFVAALLESSTVRQAAERADLPERTAWRYLGDAGVKAELARLGDGMLAQACVGLLDDMALARQTLRAIMQSEQASDAARVSAARAVLDASLRLFELVSLTERVGNLEERLEANDGRNS